RLAPLEDGLRRVEGQPGGDFRLLELRLAVADGAVLAEDRADILPVGGVGGGGFTAEGAESAEGKYADRGQSHDSAPADHPGLQAPTGPPDSSPGRQAWVTRSIPIPEPQRGGTSTRRGIACRPVGARSPFFLRLRPRADALGYCLAPLRGSRRVSG